MPEIKKSARVIASLNHQEPDCVPPDSGRDGSNTVLAERYTTVK